MIDNMYFSSFMHIVCKKNMTLDPLLDIIIFN